jgi:toxin-antitoxin system PIN domain toxin
MLLPDVNVLVYAYREDSHNHERYRSWLLEVVDSESAYGLCDLVLSGFLRVVTHPRVFRTPSPLDHAVEFTQALRARPNASIVTPGPRHWNIFTKLCRDGGVKGNLVADAYLAAVAIESGCEWVTTDGDFGRFPGLRWKHPLG